MPSTGRCASSGGASGTSRTQRAAASSTCAGVAPASGRHTTTAVSPLYGTSSFSISAWPKANAAHWPRQRARCSPNSHCQSSRIRAAQASSLAASSSPLSSISVAASRTGPRVPRTPSRAISCAWRAFSAALVRGKASQTSALNRSCALSRVGTRPVAAMCAS